MGAAILEVSVNWRLFISISRYISISSGLYELANDTDTDDL